MSVDSAATLLLLDKRKEQELICSRASIAVDDSEKNDSRSTIQRGGGEISEGEDLESDGCDSAIGGKLKTILMKPRVNEKYDLSLFLRGKQANVLKNLERELNEKRGLKLFLTVQVQSKRKRPARYPSFQISVTKVVKHT